MTTDPTEIARVAAGLTRAQRDLVLSKGQVFGMPMSALVMRPLVRRKLFDRVERKGFQVWWRITDLGHAVSEQIGRDHILREKSGG